MLYIRSLLSDLTMCQSLSSLILSWFNFCIQFHFHSFQKCVFSFNLKTKNPNTYFSSPVSTMEEKESARRVRTVLSLDCGVCSAPAPDHLHFGGKERVKPNENVVVIHCGHHDMTSYYKLYRTNEKNN